MRVCTAREMAAIDRDTIAAGVAGLELMERAGAAMAEAVWAFLAENGPLSAEVEAEQQDAAQVLIICGKGNNGGDGLVMARLLHEEGADVTVMMLSGRGDLSSETATNFDLLPAKVGVVQSKPDHWAATVGPLVARADLVVDAIFGTGIIPPLRPAHAALIRTLNDAGAPCIAVDIPSGVCGDDGRVDPVAVAADLTLTVGLPKFGLIMQPGRDFAGELEVVDIGFPEAICQARTGNCHWLQPLDYAAMLPPRPSDTHKYLCGKVLVVAGSRQYGGAAHLAALGALRSGAGLVTSAVPGCLEIPGRVGLPEALVVPLPETDQGTISPLDKAVWQNIIEGQQALAIGPGLAGHPETDAWLIDVLGQLDIPMVVDADALGAFSRQGQEPRFGGDQVVLTPHAGELARLTGLSSTQIQKQRLELVPRLARQWGVTLLLKGSTSLIGAPDGRLFFNTSGDDALARGGSGDVLTGLIGGLLAQGLAPLEAALLGAQVHGLAGTLAASGGSTRSVMVPETAAAIGPVFESLEKLASASAALREKIWPVGQTPSQGGFKE